ncbi:hypothetical protein [Paenibacillus oralis]|uniref:hypothetical protein n=1 Tax=Paenibacillus oralis TaxID=2490856 RepID=UPI001FE73873|nr:hypothetical protein [Paenibacillus oralis]
MIDELTPCLIHRQSGEQYKTEYSWLLSSDLKQVNAKSGWLFDWNKEHRSSDREVFKLLVVGSDDIQGLVSLTVDQGFVFVNLVESAPANKGSETKLFSGVGAHLFAIACKISFETGCEGFVAFKSKSSLVSHYEQAIGAQRIGNGLLMEIKPDRAKLLVKQYFQGSE